MGYYDIMQVCLYGHTINDSVRTHPQFSKSFCNHCGEPTVTQCPSCETPIEGEYQTDALVFKLHLKEAPAYCCHCGASFPWTERRIKAAIELFVEESSATAEDERQFEESLHELTKDSPRASLASHRMETLLEKVSPHIREQLGDLLIGTAGSAGGGALLKLFAG